MNRDAPRGRGQNNGDADWWPGARAYLPRQVARRPSPRPHPRGGEENWLGVRSIGDGRPCRRSWREGREGEEVVDPLRLWLASERQSNCLAPHTAGERTIDGPMHMHAQTSEFSFFVFPVIVQERAGIRACTRVRRTASRGPGRTDVSSILVCN
jgi:hypothetical protein